MTNKKQENIERYVVTDDDLKTVQEVAEKLFDLIGISAKPKVEKDKTNEAINVNIESENEAGLLIGTRGETVNSLQTIIAMIARKKEDKWIRVLVNVADWREKQNEKLTTLATQTAERAISTGEPQSLYNLNPTQRRIVHMALSENNDVITESTGEGNDRYLVVRPK